MDTGFIPLTNANILNSICEKSAQRKEQPGLLTSTERGATLTTVSTVGYSSELAFQAYTVVASRVMGMVGLTQGERLLFFFVCFVFLAQITNHMKVIT